MNRRTNSLAFRPQFAALHQLDRSQRASRLSPRLVCSRAFAYPLHFSINSCLLSLSIFALCSALLSVAQRSKDQAAGMHHGHEEHHAHPPEMTSPLMMLTTSTLVVVLLVQIVVNLAYAL